MSGRVVVTGIGAVTPLGIGADVLHEAAVRGETGIVDGLGRCRDFDPGSVLDRREARRMDRFSQFAVVAADEALHQAGWDAGLPTEPDRIPCYIGTAIGGLDTLEKQLGLLGSEGAEAVSPLSVPMLMANAAAANISIRYGLRGETAALVAACSGGAQAIVAGVRAIRSGEASAAVVGGSEATTSEFTRSIFVAAGALSPSGDSVPFDRNRDGFRLGEGAGVLVLEDAELAQARGAEVLGEVLGFGLTSDSHHLTAPDPSVAAASTAIRRALAEAGKCPEQVCYVNAHGTGTLLNDVTEVAALRAALGPVMSRIPLSSSKSYLGHLVGAAGAVEAVATLQALRHRIAPPTCGLTDPDPELGEANHLRSAKALEPVDGSYLALSNSMGFGGHNVTLALGVQSR